MPEGYQNVSLQTIDGYTVVCITAGETGLPYDILLDSLGVDNESSGRPRLGVVMGDIVVPMSIDEDPEVLSGSHFEKAEAVKEWIAKHKQALLLHWNKKLTDREVLEAVIH